MTERPKNPNHSFLEETNRSAAHGGPGPFLTNPRGEVTLPPDGNHNFRDDGVTACSTLEGNARSALDPASPQKQKRQREQQGKSSEGRPSPRAGEALV